MVVEPVGEVPELGEVDAKFEQTVFMEEQAAALVVGGDGFTHGSDGQVLGGDDGDAAVGDQLQQGWVPAVEHSASMVNGGIELAVAGHDHLVEAVLEEEDVAGFDHNLILLKYAHQIIVAHLMAELAEVVEQVDEHNATLKICRAICSLPRE